MPDEKIKAVLFDLSETLLNFGKINTTRLFRQAARSSYDFLKKAGQPVGNFHYYCWRNLISLRIHCWLSNITTQDFNSLVLLRGIGTKKGIRLDRQQWQHFAWLWYEPLYKASKTEPKTAQTLAELKKMGLKLGIVSNTFVHRYSLERHLEKLGILNLFTAKVYSYEFDFRKPDVRIFKTAAQKIGQMPENILFVGDRIDKDIKPAVKTGMRAVLKAAYTNKGEKLPKGTWKINRLCELPGLIKKINS